MITHYFPGSGITVFTVWDTPYRWWVRYVTECRALLEEQKRGK